MTSGGPCREPPERREISAPSSVCRVARTSMTATPSGRTSIQSAPTGSTRPRSRGPWKSPPSIGTMRRWPWGSTPTSIAGPTLPVRVNRNSDRGGTAGPAVPGSVVTKALFPSVKVVNLVRAEKRTDEAGDKRAARDIGLERWLGGAHAVHAAGNRVDVGQRHDGHAIAVADDQVARCHADLDENDRQPDRPWARTGRRARGDSASEHREPGSDDAGGVPGQAIGDDGSDLAVAGHSREQVTDHGRSGESVACCHQHVARPGHGEGGQDGEVVIGTGMTGKGWASERR